VVVIVATFHRVVTTVYVGKKGGKGKEKEKKQEKDGDERGLK